MIRIKNYNTYIELMKNGFYDKLFFVDKLFDTWATLIDYGCADGFTTRMLAEIFPTKLFIGYDNDPKMIEAADAIPHPANLTFTCDPKVLQYGDILYVSSTIHEIYAYCTPEQIEEFWTVAFNKHRKYVVIRDMIHNYNRENMWVNDQEAKVRAYCEKAGLVNKLASFESIYGKINKPDALVHFMIKYLYVKSPNWERELHEPYLGLNMHTLSHRGKIPAGWDFTHKSLYILPYLKHRWAEDFNITGDPPLCMNTHGKFIIHNKEWSCNPN